MPKTIKSYTDYSVKKAAELLAIDSPTGYTKNAAEWLVKEFASLGYKAEITVKGGVTVDLGGEGEGLLLMAHIDTLGGIVKEIKSDGRLHILNIGGLNANNVETENCRVVAKFSGIYEGTCQLKNASTHVNKKYNDISRNFDEVEIVLDEDVDCKDDAEALGISVGDFVCFDPRTRVTKSGYIKSRFLDDKLSSAILMGYAKYLKDNEKVPARHVYLHFTVFEEVGHGGASFLPADVTEAISVDMGCVGDDLECTEKEVSICAKDGGGPYHYDVVKGLEEAAIRCKADYAVDVYTNYSSDVDVMVKSGANVRHGCMGPGVYASHGYERSHKDGVENTLKVLAEYIG